MQPASAKWYDRRDSVFIEFLVEDSKDVKVNFEKSKFGFSCLSGTDNTKHSNEIDLFGSIDQDESKHKRTDRSVLCCLRKAEPGKSWPRITKDKAKVNWLSVDFNNWKDWEDDSDEDVANYDRFSEMMGNMGGEDDLPDLDGADEFSDGEGQVDDDPCSHTDEEGEKEDEEKRRSRNQETDSCTINKQMQGQAQGKLSQAELKESADSDDEKMPDLE